MSYPWVISSHAKFRWQERFGRPTEELLECLNRSMPIKSKLRGSLIKFTKSERHRKALLDNRPYQYRVFEKTIFVIEGVTLVTVFGFPEMHLQYLRDCRKSSKMWGHTRDNAIVVMMAYLMFKGSQ